MQYGNIPQQQPMWRVPPKGRLNLVIIEARLTKNYSMLTKMDPYIKITLAGKVFETETDYGGGKNPKWNKTIACYLPNNVDSFLLQIFDEKSFSTDEEIAVLNFTFPDELFQGVPMDEWIPLSGRLGEQKEGHIHLRLEFIPLEQLQRMQPAHIPVNQAQSIHQSHQVRIPQQQQYVHMPRNVTPAEPEYTDGDVMAIREMFPDFDEEIIKSILEANGGHKENTINQLLQMS